MDREIDPIENQKKICKCDNCGYPVRPIHMLPGTDCPTGCGGTMIELKNCICNGCLEEENAIPGNNCQKCQNGKMIKIENLLF